MLGFLGPIANLANTFVEGRVAKSKAKAKVQVAKANAEAEVMKVAATHEAGWEKIMAEASADSWKDEAWTILFIVIILKHQIIQISLHQHHFQIHLSKYFQLYLT